MFRAMLILVSVWAVHWPGAFVEALELFQLFFAENLVEILHSVDSVVEECFLSLEDASLGCCDLLFVIVVKRVVQSLFGVFLLFAEFLEGRIRL